MHLNSQLTAELSIIMAQEISKTKSVIVFGSVIVTCSAWGFGLSMPGTFYPNEAESKGAKPSQYGFVFGIIYLGIKVNF